MSDFKLSKYLQETSCRSAYGEEFDDLLNLIESRAKTGHFDVRQNYPKGYKAHTYWGDIVLCIHLKY